MKCPKCRFENPAGMKFCGGCGAKLELICPECNFSNPDHFRFCGECGQDLTLPPGQPDPSFDEKLAKFIRYLPSGITDKILAQREKIEGERKQVTVMFCDIVGFSPIVDKLGSEDAYLIMDEIYEILIHKVRNYEGTVNEMTGDGIMALFGAPISLEDAPQRSIRAGLSIHREMARFSEKIRGGAKLQPIQMRIGIHTGPVVVGTLGNDLRVEFKAVGDTVNLASRMERLAEPGTIYVTEEMFKITEGFFRFETLGEKAVKGKEEKVKVYRVIAPSTRRTRFDVIAERGLTPFVGRELELELLLDCFERTKEGRGQAFSIVAEAGVGKSRLLYEFRKAVANEVVTFLEGKCLSFSKGVAYHPIVDILKSNFNIHDDDSDQKIKEKVTKGLDTLKVDEVSTLPYLLELLSVKESGIDKVPMSPEARKDRIIEALKKIILKGSEIQPLIIAIEDLHWIDKGSEECLRYLSESISGAAVFLIFTYRPDFVPTWTGRSYYSQVILNRLSNRECMVMVTSLLGAEKVDNILEKLILEKAEGVPFFIEEFIKSLKDLKMIERKENSYQLAKNIEEVTIPSTIQDVIMARVDSLPEGAKEVLQTGSVIEREFNCELLKHVMGLPEQQLLPHLSILKDSELLYERGIFPKSTCIFKHALTREVVYDSILTKRKKKLHDKIGKSTETLYKENIEEHYGILAEHYIAGENYEKGAEYSRLTARKAEKTASLNDAIDYAKKRISSLERLPATEDVQKKIIDARTTLGLYYIQLNYHIEAKTAVDPIVDLAVRQNYKKRLSEIYTIIGTYNYLIEEDFPRAFEHLEEALKISEQENDIVSLFFANQFLGLALSLNCEFEKALPCFEKALDINVASNTLWGISAMKCMIGYFIYYVNGRLDQGYKISNEAVVIAEESGDIFSKAMAYTNHGILYHGKGFFEEAIKHLLQGVELCERINLFFWNALAQSNLGEIYFQLGEYQKSKIHYSKAISLVAHKSMIPYWTNLNKMGLAKAKVMSHEKDIDLESLYVLENKNKVKFCEGCMRRYIGEILLNIDDHHLTEAEVWINKATEADKRNGMILNLARDHALYAELLKRKGDPFKAEENLNTAKKIFRECGADEVMVRD